MIRFAEKSDVEQIARLFQQLHERHYRLRDDYYNKPDFEFYFNVVEQTINTQSELKYVVSCENDIINGYIQFCIKDYSESLTKKHYKKCLVEQIAVDEKYHRQGVGTELIAFIRNYAIDNNCNSIELSVWYENYDAVEFYSAIGFEPRTYKMEMRLP